MNTLPSEFVDIRNFLAKIPRINMGGCAIAALAMYRVGVRIGLNIKIVYFYSYIDDRAYMQNSALIKSGSGNPTYCTHAGVLIDNHYIDSSKLLNDCYPYHHILPESLVIRTLKEDVWNSHFNRRKWLPIIEEKIKETLLV